MEVQRLQSVLASFLLEIVELGIQGHLNALVGALQQSQAGNNPSAEQTFREGLQSIFNALDKSPSNSWPPSKKLLLETLGLTRLTGKGLRARIHSLLTADVVLKTAALNELNSLVTELTKKVQESNQTVEGLKSFGLVPPTPAEDDEAEIAFSLPNSIDTSNLNAVETELKYIDLLLKGIAEVNGESIGSAKIREISSGSLLVTLLASFKSAKTVIDVVSKVLEVLKQIRDLKDHLKKSEELKLPQTALDSIAQLIDGRLKQGADEISAELIQNSVDLAPDGVPRRKPNLEFRSRG
jgi:uncharacterized protein YoxC